jgi:hypothetical protein
VNDPRVAIIIPFRDRGVDLRRGANLEVVQAWWYAQGMEPQIVDDGLSGDAQFNRHRAYNRAVSRNPDADVFVFTEADMLIPLTQIRQAVRMSMSYNTGLVVPFTQYRYLSDSTTEIIREVYQDRGVAEIARWWSLPADNPKSIFGLTPETTMDEGRSIGAVNVVSRETLDITGGFTEATFGNWYDDRITEEGFAYLTGEKTQFVTGPAAHLYHLPGWTGAHLTREDKNATHRNRVLLDDMRRNIREDRVARVQKLMAYRQPN